MKKRKIRRAAFHWTKALHCMLLSSSSRRAPSSWIESWPFLGICVRNKDGEGEIKCVRNPSKEEKELWGRWGLRRRRSLQCGEPSQEMEGIVGWLSLRSLTTPARRTSSKISLLLNASAPITIPITFTPTFYLGRLSLLFLKEEEKWNHGIRPSRS